MNNNGPERISKQSDWTARIDRFIPVTVKSFKTALPTLITWMSIPLCMLIIGLTLQWGIPQRTSVNSGNNLKKIEFTSEADDTLILFISHPRELLIQPLGTPPAQSISIWLEYATPTFGPSPTLTVTPPPSKTPKTTQIPTNNTSQPGSATQPALSSPTVDNYKVYLLPNSNDVMLVDETGIAIPHYLMLTPSDSDMTPAVLYIQPQPGNDGETEIGVSINNDPVEKSANIQVDLETSRESFQRQIGLQICGTPLFISALITALIGFAIQDWNKRTEEWKKRQENEKEVYKEINKLKGLLLKDPSEGLRYYLEILERSDPLWQEPETRVQLQSVCEKIIPREIFVLAQLEQIKNNDNELVKFCNPLEYEELMKTLEKVDELKVIDEDWKSRKLALIIKLEKLHRKSISGVESNG